MCPSFEKAKNKEEYLRKSLFEEKERLQRSVECILYDKHRLEMMLRGYSLEEVKDYGRSCVKIDIKELIELIEEVFKISLIKDVKKI